MGQAPNDSHALLSDLQERITSTASWQQFGSGQRPYWFSRMLTALLLTIGDERVAYVSSGWSAESSRGTVVVFTDTRWIKVVTPATREETDETFFATARSRAELRAISVGSAMGVWDGSFEDWPGVLTCELQFGSDPELLRLPLERGFGRQTDLSELIAGLLKDLPDARLGAKSSDCA